MKGKPLLILGTLLVGLLLVALWWRFGRPESGDENLAGGTASENPGAVAQVDSGAAGAGSAGGDGSDPLPAPADLPQPPGGGNQAPGTAPQPPKTELPQGRILARLGPNPKIIDARVKELPDGNLELQQLVETEQKYPFVAITGRYAPAGGGAAPGGASDRYDLVNETAMVADHVMVQFQGEPSEAEVGAGLPAGWSVRRRFINPGLFLIGLPEADLDAVPEALAEITGAATVEIAEPDYLVFPD